MAVATKKVRLRRGFKSEANGYARDLRAELELQPTDPLDPFVLAEELKVPVERFSRIRFTGVAQPLQKDRNALSGVTLLIGCRYEVWVNDKTSLGRTHANLAHELSHVLLRHKGVPLDAEGLDFENAYRVGESETEEAEANWLGPALLVSEEAAISVVQQGLSVPAAARMFQVSNDVMQMRINVTGARKRVRRSRPR